MLKLHKRMNEKLKKEHAHNVKVVYTLTGGLPEEEILNVSETYDPDLIIMGTRGRGEKDMLTGKVSSKVVQNATCRILTVPRDAKYHGFDNILYATDFNDEDLKDIERLIDLLSSYKPMIHCLHVDTENREAEVSKKLDKLKSYFDLHFQQTKIKFEYACDDHFLDCVNRYVKENKIDMIAIVHRRKGFLKRLFVKDHTRELLFHSDVPLYIFPGRKD
jgi:nucleotide-binding universal stress UspA family protein